MARRKNTPAEAPRTHAFGVALFVPLLLPLLLLLLSCGDDDAPFRFAEGAPEDVGMDAAVLEGAREYAFAEGRHTQGVVVVRRGVIVAEWYAPDRGPESLGASWSVGKSFASATVGIALDRGEIPSVDEPMTTYIPEWEGTHNEGVTLRDVLEMASGLSWVEDYDITNIAGSDIAQLVLDEGGDLLGPVLDNERAHPPGTRFNYSSGDAMLLSRVISAATGMSAGDYAQQHLFEPMGIDNAAWWQDQQGQTLTYCCVDMSSRDFARFGQLFLNGGELGGRRIVSEAWVRESTAPSRSWGGYGYQWWRSGFDDPNLPDDTYSARGHDGQYIYVIPSEELVVVRNGLYAPYWQGTTVAEPNLFAVYPSDGIFPGRGTVPPDSWDDSAFLGPVLASIVE